MEKLPQAHVTPKCSRWGTWREHPPVPELRLCSRWLGHPPKKHDYADFLRQCTFTRAEIEAKRLTLCLADARCPQRIPRGGTRVANRKEPHGCHPKVLLLYGEIPATSMLSRNADSSSKCWESMTGPQGVVLLGCFGSVKSRTECTVARAIRSPRFSPLDGG